jgi:hypothetical protein
MKKLKLSLIIAPLLLIGCGGGNSSSDKNTTQPTNTTEQNITQNNLTTKKISGKVVDGYVKDAKVCVDLNNNFKCDNNEPFTKSDENGNYSININNDKNYTLISIGGIDTENNMPAITMFSNTYYKNITPLTTLAIKYGEDKVAEFYNIDKSKIAADPIKNNEIKNIVTDIVNALKEGEDIFSENSINKNTEQNTTNTKENINDINNSTKDINTSNINEINTSNLSNQTTQQTENQTPENETNTSNNSSNNNTATNIQTTNGDENTPPQINGNLEMPPQIGE